jgi:hypothetical protein
VTPGDTPATPPQRRRTYRLTRFVLLRALGFVYVAAFYSALRQLVPLIGVHGLLPIGAYLARVHGYYGSAAAAWYHLPTVFWLSHSDAALTAVSASGLVLSCVLLAGFANVPLMAALWVLYLSIVHGGQDWYGYGWEIQLGETGFLAIFLCPLVDARPFPRRDPPTAVIWLFRWLAFRIMLGAGLIKLRGDSAWRDLTALFYHFETQPIPNPLSRWFHFLPRLCLRLGVAFNHLAELIAPWFVFGPRAARLTAGAIIVVFQLTLIAGGNLSFLNYLTIVPALACFDDAFWAKVLPRALLRLAERPSEPSFGMGVAGWAVACLVAILSVQPVANLFSPRQIMNTSFDPFELVNTYGAFGSVGRERLNVVFEGTDDGMPLPSSVWRPYPYLALPVDLGRRPVQIAPYQPRLDWQMWFASMATPEQYPWTVHLVWKLLHNDPGALSLFAGNPFPDHPPRFIRATLYRYRFAPPGNQEGRWWNRVQIGPWLPPLSVDDVQFRRFLAAYGWLPSPSGGN